MRTSPQETLPRVGEARIVDRAPRRVAVARTTGDPAAAAATVVPVLYRAVYRLKLRRKAAGADFPVEALRARWPNAQRTPRAEWEGIWALPVPDDVTVLTDAELPLAVETWAYGPCAEIVHEGAYAAEGESLRRLQALVDELGYEVAGPHEEEYLTRPGAPRPRTLIRRAVRRR